MPLIVWDPQFATGVTKIDEQHQELIKLINELQDALSVGKGKEILGNVLNGVATYTPMHFRTEEEFMQKYDYPDYQSHKTIHDNLIKQVIELQGKFNSGAMFLSTEVMKFLQNWLSHHISNVDKKLGAFLNTQGLR